MSKSKGNFYTLADLLEKGASPAAIRLELTKTHYRVNASFTFQGLRDSQRQIDRWSRLEDALQSGGAVASDEAPLAAGLSEFTRAISDDLNVAGALGALNQAVGRYTLRRDAVAPAADELDALRKMMYVLGVLDLQRRPTCGGGIDEDLVESKIQARNQARTAKNWAASDRIRDELVEMGIAIKDGPEGTTWTRKIRK